MMKVDFPQLMQSFGAEENRPRTKAETIAFLTSEGERFASYLEDLSDEFLSEAVTMPPGADPSSRTRMAMLMSAKEHEMHHRGQLMLLERMIGITPHLTREAQARMARAQPAAAARRQPGSAGGGVTARQGVRGRHGLPSRISGRSVRRRWHFSGR